jgi:hypothetical protein
MPLRSIAFPRTYAANQWDGWSDGFAHMHISTKPYRGWGMQQPEHFHALPVSFTHDEDEQHFAMHIKMAADAINRVEPSEGEK